MSFLVERDSQNGQQEANFSNPMDSLYREFLKDQQRDPESVTYSSQTDPDHSQAPRPDPDSDRSHALDDCNGRSSESNQSTPTVGATQSPRPESSSSSSSSVPQKLTVNQPIGRVTSRQGRSSPVTVSGKVEEISDEEIRNNRETEDGIRGMSRFQDYQRGEPSNVGFLCSGTKRII